GKTLSGVPVAPTSPVAERLGEVPVVKRRHRRDATSVQPIEQAPVEVDPLLVDPTRTLRQDSRPRNRETIGANSELGEQIEVRLHPVVVVTGDVTGIAVMHLARCPAKGI